MFPIHQQIDGDDWSHHHQGEDRDHGLTIRPQRAQKSGDPVGGHGRNLACRLLGFAQSLADELAQPGAVWIIGERLQSRDVLGNFFDERGDLRAKERNDQHQHAADTDDEHTDNAKRGHGTVQPKPLDPVDHGGEQISEGDPGHERQQDFVQEDDQQGDGCQRPNPDHGRPRRRLETIFRRHRRSPMMARRDFDL